MTNRHRFIICLAVLGLVLSTWASAEPFTVVLLPDTQNYSEKYPDTYLAQTEWIASRVEEDNIRFVIHLGDIVQVAERENEWKAADRAQKVLEGVVPYSLAVGNHDMDKANDAITRGTTLYNTYFPPSRFKEYPWYGGHKDDTNVNNYCLFEGGGMKFMVISLEFAPSKETLDWVAEVIAAHPYRRVIIATHYYMRPEGRGQEDKPYGIDGAGPEVFWNSFISKQPAIFMVVSGHVLGVHHQTSENEAGRPVHEILCDYQGEANGGDGWLQTLRFVPEKDTIEVKAYSPTLDQHRPDPPHSYNLPYVMPGE